MGADKIELVRMAGGLDLVSPALDMSSGSLIDAKNFEPDINGGYRRMDGIERYSGQTSPSDALYYVMAVNITGTIVAGNTITGQTSGATALVLQVNGTTELILIKKVGTFVAENITVSAVVQGTASTSVLNGAQTPMLHATYKSLAADNYRADIAAPTGAGAIRGVHNYNGTNYCFRNNVGNTECLMYKSTSTGWVQIVFGKEIQFTNAVGQIFEGDTVTGVTSGATAVVKRALLRTGTWSVSGIGSLVFDSITGTFQNGEALRVGGVTKATSSSLGTQISLPPNGKYEFINYNFTGSTSTYRMYGCNGVGTIFEFDGTRLVPIRTSIGTDTPSYITAWKNMLVIGIGASVSVSGIGQPFSWTALTGAAELALGDTCTGLSPQLGDANSGALAIFTRNQTLILYGNSTADFKLVIQSPDAGSAPYTVQNIGYAYYLDTKGVVQINATRAFGNFNMSTLTRKVQPIIDSKRGTAVASCIVRNSNQYRIFYSDGTGIILHMVPASKDAGGGVAADDLGATMFFDYGTSKSLNVVESYVDLSGIERIIAGGNDGMVYELNKGTSIDGGNISAHMMMAFNSNKSPRNRKHYKRTLFQAICKNTAQIKIGYELSYSSSEAMSGARTDNALIGGGSFWDIMQWDNFTWDAPYVTDYKVDTRGNGTNISFVVFSDNKIDESYTIHSCTLNYTIGRLER
jgi:hypothetical protein